MKVYRYPGVRPFEAADKALFFGRDRDIADLYEMIRAERLVVLFGKSGYGKSSLLNAGVLPRLRQVLTPVEVRLGEYIPGQSLPPVETVRGKAPVQHKLKTDAAFLAGLPTTLWTHFKQLDSAEKGAYLLVFDQFEEFFSYPPEQQRAFRDQLADLLSGELPEDLREAARTLDREQRRLLTAPMDIRVLFAIRSDRLHELDRLKDRLPAILHKRYELKALSREQAREAIIGPAALTDPRPDLREGRITMTPMKDEWAFASPPFEYREDALTNILNGLAITATVQQSGVEAFQLQILCDSIESRVAAGLVPDRDGNGRPDVTAADLPDFTEVFAQYYERRLAHLPETERAAARRVIEDGLVRYDPFTDEGRRLSVDGQALLKDYENIGLHPDLLRELENTFLVRREPNTLGGHNYELSHDTLLAPVVQAKKQRMAEEEEQRRAAEEAAERERLRQEREKIARARRRNAVVGLLALALLLFAFYQMNTASDAKRQAKTEQQNADKAKREAADATEEAERQQRIADLAKKDALTLAEKAELAELKAQSEQAKAARANREVAEKSKILVLNLLEKADEDIYRLKYEDALKKIQAAASIGPEKVAVARAFMEIAYWNAETGRLGPAQTAAAEAARLLGRADLAASAAKAADRLALRDVLARLDTTHFAFLEARYFPDWVRIPGGEFMMGSPEGIGDDDEQPEHPVRLSDFRLARTETTFWQFALYTENNKLDIQTFAPSWGIGGNHPVVNVSWYDAARYANWLSAREGRKPAYVFEGDYFKEIDFDANGYRLPTEAQWEYAARSGGKNETYAGFSETAELYLYANFCDAACEYGDPESPNDGYRFTSPAGHYKPNGLELFDMSGNVWEWCQDWKAPYDSTLQINPVGPKKGGHRVFRGGSWNGEPADLRVRDRISIAPDIRNNYVGFRLVRPF